MAFQRSRIKFRTVTKELIKIIRERDLHSWETIHLNTIGKAILLSMLWIDISRHKWKSVTPNQMSMKLHWLFKTPKRLNVKAMISVSMTDRKFEEEIK